MRLKIRNFAKVREADIILDGITVIAGKNNTGKSTVGKVLDSMYNSTSNIEIKMKNAKRSRLRNNISRVMGQAGSSENYAFHSLPAMPIETLDGILEAESSEEELRLLERYINLVASQNSGVDKEGLKTKVLNAIMEVKSIPDEVLTRGILSNFFVETFNGNINNTDHPGANAEVELITKGGKNAITFWNDVCEEFKFDYKVMNSSFYLDNPMLIDKLNSMDGIRPHRWAFSEQEYHLLTKLRRERIPAEDRALNEIINREKLEDVLRILDRVIPGAIIYDQKYEYKTEKGKSGIDVRSLSTGLKSFAILKQLILNGSLNDKDAIVLDEPEIHLHPEWQMLYAELIVVLQKKFDFNFIVNTHSSHFLETLDFCAEKYERKERCHYYLSVESEGMCTFEDVTNIPEKIYKQLVDPSLLLAKEKETWEDEHGAI